jgi:hypothetical protein
MSERYMGLLVMVAYFLLVQMLRRQYVADPLRQWARSRLATQRRRLEAMPESHDDEHAAAVRRSTETLLQTAEESLTVPRGLCRLRELFSWSGSAEAGAVSTAHEAERLIVAWLLPDASVLGRLERARCELESLPAGQRRIWSDALDGLEWQTPSVVRATLGEMLADVYARRDTSYSELWSLKNKIAWFEWAGLLAAGVLVWQGSGMLLFAGAVGGLLSRMQRALKRRPIRTDYGFSWSLLFLSPIAGAIAAWAGMYLILGLEKSGVVADVSAAFGAHPLTQPTTSVVAVAILLGISERFFDRVVALAGHSIVPEIDPAAATSAQSASLETLRPVLGT